MKTGVANLPLHGGHCPKWLFPRMKNLSREMSKVIVLEYGQDELLRRLSDPYWFQAFGCVLGFDWHSSGLTTTVCGALKEGLKQEDIGVTVCGGKGGASRKTPEEILKAVNNFGISSQTSEDLVYASKMAAKIDNNCVQDGYQLYHHVFVMTEKGKWSVIQQGLNNDNRYARRYHWLSENVNNFIEEPQQIAGSKEKIVLNMVAKQSKESQTFSLEALKEQKFLHMPAHHDIRELTPRTVKNLQQAWEINPDNYEELVSLKGVGPQSIRALALISQLIYGKEPSWEDPVKYSFAHGGKDGFPYPVNREGMDRNIEILRTAVENAKIAEKERLFAIRKLNEFLN